jgi:thiosulfate/3-mercaptopyruvate sulfurtransferase
VPEVPAHEKVLVDAAFLDDTNHGVQGCDACHGGDPQGEARADAHLGLVADPTVGDGGPCKVCHIQIAELSARSLHTTMRGIRHSLVARSGGATLVPPLETAFNNHCSRCHSSCGNCHISTPAAAGGGLLAGHKVKKTPPMTNVCSACHGSRVTDEYKGQNAGLPADLHYFRGMQCTACHSGAEMHGEGADGVTSRYQVTSAPRCTDCHPDDTAFGEEMAHQVHREADGTPLLSCQVCHSVTYKNCSSCHVSLTDEGAAIYEVNAPSHESLMTFKIGLNPSRDALHPEKWVPVRHAPGDPLDYAFYGEGLLTSFDAEPTWHLATPHNIQRVTPQNGGCTATCHGVRELFLGPGDLAPYEVDANAHVVVPDEALP